MLEEATKDFTGAPAAVSLALIASQHDTYLDLELASLTSSSSNPFNVLEDNDDSEGVYNSRTNTWTLKMMTTRMRIDPRLCKKRCEQHTINPRSSATLRNASNQATPSQSSLSCSA
jgi:hypothetical protein